MSCTGAGTQGCELTRSQVPSAAVQGGNQTRPCAASDHKLHGRDQRSSCRQKRHHHVLGFEGRCRRQSSGNPPSNLVRISTNTRWQHLGRNLAVELGLKGITSNVIAPGFFPSKLAQGLIKNLGGEDDLSRDNPLGRLGEPEDIAGVATFLCSAAGKYV